MTKSENNYLIICIMNINGKTTLNNGYFLVAGMVLFVLMLSNKGEATQSQPAQEEPKDDLPF